MVNIVNPRQNELFDIFKQFLSPLAYKTLLSGWQGVFRHIILSVLPADEIANHFHPDHGRPTKELYSIAGLLLIKEFMDWTEAEAANAYMFNVDIQYALNLGRDNISMSERTIQRYERIFREDDYANQIMTEVTGKLIAELDVDISKQRLDSTHVFSDMATFARTRLMGVAIKRFMTQLKRHSGERYDALPETLRRRYEVSQGGLFGEVACDNGRRSTLRQEVAEEMYFLITTFSGVAEVEGRTTYKDLVSIFDQQCDVVEGKQKIDKDSDDRIPPKNEHDTENNASESSEAIETKETPPENERKEAESLSGSSDADPLAISATGELPEIEVKVKKKTGGRVIQNPSDPEATYSGHKGAGYQVQLVETCCESNEIELITYACAETACEADCNAVKPALDALEQERRLPDKMFADTLYGSDKNVVECEGRGVKLISPTCGTPPKEPPKHPSEKQKRLAERRKQEQSREWREEYNIRAGIEGTNSGVKRRTGMARLRVRGQKSVSNVILLKITGWNILRAASSKKMKEIIARLAEKTGSISDINPRLRFIRLDVLYERTSTQIFAFLAA